MIPVILFLLGIFTCGSAVGAPPRKAVAPSPGSVEAGAYPLYDARTAWMPRPAISEYDSVMRRVGAHMRVDWRLLAAIAYHESRFDPSVVSHRGARGIMQITPVVARHFGVPRRLITDTGANVMLAAMLLREIERTVVGIPPGRDRMSITVACYNAGLRNVGNARRLARMYGHSADLWEGISRFLPRETRAFVRNVMERYGEYCRTVPI